MVLLTRNCFLIMSFLHFRIVVICFVLDDMCVFPAFFCFFFTSKLLVVSAGGGVVVVVSGSRSLAPSRNNLFMPWMGKLKLNIDHLAPCLDTTPSQISYR